MKVKSTVLRPPKTLHTFTEGILLSVLK